MSGKVKWLCGAQDKYGGLILQEDIKFLICKFVEGNFPQKYKIVKYNLCIRCV